MRILVALLFVATALAGCSDAPAASAPEDTFGDLGGKATETTGLIRGVVVDPAIFPIEGATITLVGSETDTTTNADGAFVIDGLEPGFHTVRASKLGFVPVQQQVEVVAGVDRPPAVKIQMPRDTEAIPYFVPWVWQGYMVCSTSAVQVCGAPNTVVQTFCQGGVDPFCILPQDITGDDFMEHFDVDKPPTWAQAEIAWRSTQALGDTLTVFMEAFQLDGLAFEGLGSATGTSPVVVSAGPERINGTSLGQDGSQFGGLIPLQLRVFAGASETAGGAVGAVVEQGWESFVHIFYGYSPPEGWRFTEDPDVPRPE